MVVLWMALQLPIGAHPVSLTTALVNVDDEEIRVDLEVMVQDLVLFYELDADENWRFPFQIIQEQAMEHGSFLLKHFHLLDIESGRLEGKVVEVDFSDLPDEGVSYDDLMAYTIVYHLVFDLEGRPSHLTVAQDFGGEWPLVPSEMTTRIFHHGVFQDAARLSHRTSHTVEVDWETNWLAMDDDLEKARRRMREREAEALGITSYSAVYTYLYITPTGVRLEMLIPFLTLEEWVGILRENPDLLTVDEQEAAVPSVLEFLTRHAQVEINGRQVSAELSRMDFFGPDFRDFAVRTPPRTVAVFSARVGAVLEYPVPTAPRQVAFEWDFYDDRLHYLRPRVFVYDEDSRDVLFDYYPTRFEWEGEAPTISEAAILMPPEPLRMLRVPLLTLVLGAGALVALGTALRRRRKGAPTGGALAMGAGLALAATALAPVASISVPLEPGTRLPGDHAQATMEGLLTQLYQAFEHRNEERVYDTLEQSVSGDLLEEMYLQIRRNLEMAGQGGALARLEELNLLSGEPRQVSGGDGYPAFEYLADWTVRGTIEHWGHIHSRKNRYRARFRVEGSAEGWRITAFQPLDEERLEMEVRLRS